jgi:hypothetical protein
VKSGGFAGKRRMDEIEAEHLPGITQIDTAVQLPLICLDLRA